MTAWSPQPLPPDLAALNHRFVLESRTVVVNGNTWTLDRPRSAEDLINEDDFARDERLPYWADLWPSAIVLAQEVASRHGRGLRAIELGAGLGLPSLAAAHAGFAVTATDYYTDALLFARRNVWRNLGQDVETELLDWRDLPDVTPRFELVLAADVLYERQYAPLVARAILRLLAPDGVALIADPGRVALAGCLAACKSEGASVRLWRSARYEEGEAKHTITLHEIRYS